LQKKGANEVRKGIKTDENGLAEFPRLERHTLTVSVTAKGYRSYFRWIRADTGSSPARIRLRAMGKVTQMKQKQERAGTHIPILPLGGSKRVSASDWRKDLVVSWLFQTCIRLQTSLNRRFLKFGMTVQEASVLLRCVEARQSSPGKLSAVLGRDKAMVTRFVDRLEAVHLITRERNPRDKRLSIIKPTGKGKRLAQDLASVFDKVRRELFVGTRERDIWRLSQLLRKLHQKAERIGIPANGHTRRRRIGRRRVRVVGLQAGQVQLAEPSVPPHADHNERALC
jgi:DNA-binding MarR family transcriptional regulator